MAEERQVARDLSMTAAGHGADGIAEIAQQVLAVGGPAVASSRAMTPATAGLAPGHRARPCVPKTTEVRIAAQFGIAYLPFTVMRRQRLLE